MIGRFRKAARSVIASRGSDPSRDRKEAFSGKTIGAELGPMLRLAGRIDAVSIGRLP